MPRMSKNDLSLVVLVGILAVISTAAKAVMGALAVVFGFLLAAKIPLMISAAVIFSIPFSYLIYQYFYFESKAFKDLREGISQYTKNCNELNHHILELKSAYSGIKSFDYGTGVMNDDSRVNFKRPQWSAGENNRFVHNCSAVICKNAHNQPLKYLCKYFDIVVNELSLSMIESVLNDFAAAEQGKYLLKNERDRILDDIKGSVPWVINTFSKQKLIRELGFEDIDLSDVYFPVYSFKYVSSGGNSSMSCDIKLDVENLDKLVSYMRELIKFSKSIAGQRALMTSALREKIKARDNYSCRICGISTHVEKNLLLEIDHIIPLSRGGITSEGNLQTLCWRCNRSKGSKIYNYEHQTLLGAV